MNPEHAHQARLAQSLEALKLLSIFLIRCCNCEPAKGDIEKIRN